MQDTSAAWKALLASEKALLEAVAVIGGKMYREITAPVISRGLMQGGLSIGNAVSASCQFTVRTVDAIPKSAKVQIRMRLNDGQTVSEWRPAGTFYISHRSRDIVAGLMTLECYDALMKANANMPVFVNEPWTDDNGTTITTNTGEIMYFYAAMPEPGEGIDDSAFYPYPMDRMAGALAAALGVEIDPRTQIATGAAYVVEQPERGTTIHDVLGLIAAANGGSWIITPEGKLRLVPVISADNAQDALLDVVDVAAVLGQITLDGSGTITGLRYNTDEEPVLIGDETGIVVETDVTAAIAYDLSETLIGMTYQAYGLQGAIYDPAAELGDYVRAGANGEIRSALYSETVTLGPMFRGDISAPETGEMSDEYPYIGASAKALNIAKNYADSAVLRLDDSLGQQSIFDRLTNNGVEQGVYLQDGKVYINGTYIQAGEMSANRIKGGTLELGGLDDVNGTLVVKDASGNTVGMWNNAGLDITAGKIQTETDGNIVGLNVDMAWVAAMTHIYPFYVSYTPDPSNVTRKIVVSIEKGVFEIAHSWGPETRAKDAYVDISENGIDMYSRSGGIGPTKQIIAIEDFYGYGTIGSASIQFKRTKSSSSPWLSITPGITGLSSPSMNLDGDFTVTGTKNRVVSTDQYSDRLLYCYETPSPLFGDVGEGEIGEDGRCYVWLDAVFAQTISTDSYQVFLQRYGAGDCWVAERRPGCFVVEGAPGLRFGWEIKAKQRDFDQRRMEPAEQPHTPTETDYGALAAAHINEIRQERETA